MDIQNQILSFDDYNGSILVRYFTSDFPEGFTYNIDLPIVNGQYPNEADIQELIKTHEPRGQLERIVAAKTAVIPENLKIKSITADSQPSVDKATLIRSRRDEMLLASDYTQLPDVNFSAEEVVAWRVYRQELRDITQQNGFPDTVIFPLPPSAEPR